MERAEQVLIQGIPQSQLGSDSAAEQLANVHPITALRGGGQTEKLQGLNMIEQSPIGRRLGMMKLIDHDNIEVVGRQR